jgi:ABC-type polysaccharide/polyol phosphate transport system ATPase subunit
MSGETIISVENVSKAYRIWGSPAARLRSPLLDAAASAFPKNSPPHRALASHAARGWRDFYALRDISFKVRRGQGTGIIGRNGSGKSTLLQLIAGTLQPTTGSIDVQGRVAALLELGSGFNPDFTGRENVYLNGAIYGFSQNEMDARFPSIADFAEIGSFMDQPVKIYSSGMMVRLAFAVATATQPDILIVDEALSVGDVFFQQKCFARIREMLANGTTLLFVSHDVGGVQNLCSHAVLLHEGAAVFQGPPEEAASRYYALSGRGSANAATTVRPDAASSTERAKLRADLAAEFSGHNILPRARSRHGNGEMKIEAACFINELGEHSMTVEMGKRATLQVRVRAERAIPEPSVGLNLIDRMNNLVFAAGTRQLGAPMPPMSAGDERVITFRLELSVQPGEYTFSVGCGEPSDEGPNHGYVQDRHEGLGPITVHANAGHLWPFYGIARLPLEISVL